MTVPVPVLVLVLVVPVIVAVPVGVVMIVALPPVIVGVAVFMIVAAIVSPGVATGASILRRGLAATVCFRVAAGRRRRGGWVFRRESGHRRFRGLWHGWH